MKRIALLSVFVLLAIGANAQHISLKDSAEFAAFNTWVSNLKMQGKDKGITEALNAKYQDAKKEKEIKTASEDKSAFESMDNETFKKTFLNDIDALIQSLNDASRKYKDLAVVKADNIMRINSAMNSVALLEISNNYAYEASYFASFAENIKKSNIEDYNIKALYSAAARVNGMTFAVKASKLELFKEFRAEFATFIKTAGIK